MLACVDVTDIVIETPRLIMRAWEEHDLSDLYAYASVPGVGEMAGWVHHKSIGESKQILDMFIREKKTFALVLKKENRVIGSLGLEAMEPDPVTGEGMGREIGYVLSRDHWGKGLMTEAVKAVTAYCFDVLNYDYLTCGHFLRNDRSRHVIEKCGFVFFGMSQYETRYDTVEISKNYILFNPNK